MSYREAGAVATDADVLECELTDAGMDERPDWGDMQRELLAAKLREEYLYGAAEEGPGRSVQLSLSVFRSDPAFRAAWLRVANVAIEEIQGTPAGLQQQ